MTLFRRESENKENRQILTILFTFIFSFLRPSLRVSCRLGGLLRGVGRRRLLGALPG